MKWFNEHPFIRDLIWGFFELTSTFIAFNFFRFAIHEWCHLEVLQYFGGDGYIVRNAFGVGVHFTKMPSNVTAVAFAGGIGIAAFLALLMYHDWDDDPETAAAFPPLIFSELFYGITEGLWIFGNPALYNQYSNLAWTIGFLVGLFVTIILAVKWLMKLSNQYKA